MTRLPNTNGGLCHCGCGLLAPATKRKRGVLKKGELQRFIQGHTNRGSQNPHWEGGRFVSGGYVHAYAPDHPRQRKNYVYEHILVAEKMLGRPLEDNEEVHHLNRDGTDNSPANLEVLDGSLHARTCNAKAIVSPEGYEWSVIW